MVVPELSVQITSRISLSLYSKWKSLFILEEVICGVFVIGNLSYAVARQLSLGSQKFATSFSFDLCALEVDCDCIIVLKLLLVKKGFIASVFQMKPTGLRI